MRFWPFGRKKKRGSTTGPTLNIESLSLLMGNGRLAEAFAQVKGIIARGSPEDHFILFNMCLVTGDFELASRALDGIAAQEAEYAAPVQTCRQLLEAELWRQDWRASGDRRPAMLSDPPNFVKLQCKAWHERLHGQEAQGLETLDAALEARPSVQGELRTHDKERVRFDDIGDADTYNEPSLEVLSPDRFFLVPFSDIISIEMEPPRSIFEAILMPADLKTRSGTNGMVWVPTLYAGSHLDDDDNIRVGNGSKWRGRDGVTVGSGQRMLRLLPAGGEDEEETEGVEIPWKLIRSIRVEEVAY